MTKYIKNNTNNEKYYAGHTIPANSFYEIPVNMYLKFASTDNLLIDIASGDANLSKDGISLITGINDQINFLKNEFYDIDTEGRQIVRAAAGKKGWTYQTLNIEFSTSDLNSAYCKDIDGNNISGISKKIYNSSDVEITTPGLLNANLGTCVKTVLDIEPTYDYEIIGGSLRQKVTPGSDVRMWVIAVPDIAYNSGGSRLMCEGGLNLRFIDATNRVDMDGKASKYMTYNATYHTNKIRVVVKHPAGYAHDILIQLFYFRA